MTNEAENHAAIEAEYIVDEVDETGDPIENVIAMLNRVNPEGSKYLECFSVEDEYGWMCVSLTHPVPLYEKEVTGVETGLWRDGEDECAFLPLSSGIDTEPVDFW